MDKLRAILPIGSTLYTVTRGVSRSGYQERLSVFAVVDSGGPLGATIADLGEATYVALKGPSSMGISLRHIGGHHEITLNGDPISASWGRDIADKLGEVLYGTCTAFHHRAL